MPDWKTYYLQTKDLPPSPLLLKALPYVKKQGRAIDIGGGALKDTRYLLEQGFEVTVIDQDESLKELAAFIHHDRLRALVTSFSDFDFPRETFDLASAMFALPFNPPETFEVVFTNIKKTLTPNGIFCGQLFGRHDEWGSNTQMTFHTKEQVENLLADLEILKLDEREFDGKLASGLPKHWHFFDLIARKNG